jgi:hypothetical protein
MNRPWQLLNGLQTALLESPRLPLMAVLAIATLARCAALASVLVADRRQAQQRRRGG